MAEAFEAELRITGVDEATQQMRGLSESMGEASESAESSAFSFLEMKAKLDLTIAAVTKIQQGIATFANEVERVTGIMNRFNGNVDLAVQRTNGLYTQLQLVIAQSRLAQAGLNLTAQEFANAAVAANEFASATGTNNVQALDQLAQALRSGSGEALRAFGVNVEGVTGVANIQRAAIEQLNSRYGNMESSADTLGGALQVLSNRATDFSDEVLTTIGRSTTLKTTIDELTTAVAGANTQWDDLNEGALSDAQALGVGLVAVFDAMANAVVNAVGVMTNAVRFFANIASADFDEAYQVGLQFQRNLENLGNLSERFRTNIATGAAEAAASTNGDLAPGGGAGGGGGGTTRGRRGGGSGGGADAFATLLAQNARTEEDLLNGIAEQMANIGEIENEFMEAKLRELEISDKLLQNEKDAYEATQEKLDAVERFQGRQQKGLETAQEFTQILIDAGSKAVQGEAKFGKALKLTLKEWLGGFAKREALLGASDLAQAIGKSFSAPQEAATLYISGAQHIALAAAAGGGAAAIPGGGGGGGGGGGARPESNAGAGGGGGGDRTVVININTPTPEADIGRTISDASRAASARYGSGRGL